MSTKSILGRTGVALAVAGILTAGTATTAMADTTTATPSSRVVDTVVTKAGTLTIRSRPALVHPDSSEGCTGADPEVCLIISGGGLWVNYMENETIVKHSSTITILIKNAAGHVYATHTENATGGDEYTIDWAPGAYEPAGTYCAGTIINGAGTYACGNVSN